MELWEKRSELENKLREDAGKLEFEIREKRKTGMGIRGIDAEISLGFTRSRDKKRELPDYWFFLFAVPWRLAFIKYLQFRSQNKMSQFPPFSYRALRSTSY